MDIGSILSYDGGLGAVLASIVGAGIFTYAFDWYRRPTKQLAVCVSTDNLVRKLSSWVSDLVVHYQDRLVTAASVSRVVVWNNGRKELRREDIAPAAPIRVQARAPSKILSVSLLKSSSESNRSTVTPLDAQGTASLDFDFLNPRDGIAIQVVHTGTSDVDLSVSGEVIGGGTIRPTDPWRKWVMAILSVALFAGFVIFAGAIQTPTPGWVLSIYLGVFMLLALLALAILRWPERVLLKPHALLKSYVRPYNQTK